MKIENSSKYLKDANVLFYLMIHYHEIDRVGLCTKILPVQQESDTSMTPG